MNLPTREEVGDLIAIVKDLMSNTMGLSSYHYNCLGSLLIIAQAYASGGLIPKPKEVGVEDIKKAVIKVVCSSCRDIEQCDEYSKRVSRCKDECHKAMEIAQAIYDRIYGEGR